MPPRYAILPSQRKRVSGVATVATSLMHTQEARLSQAMIIPCILTPISACIFASSLLANCCSQVVMVQAMESSFFLLSDTSRIVLLWEKHPAFCQRNASKMLAFNTGLSPEHSGIAPELRCGIGQ